MACIGIDCFEMYNSNATQTRGKWTGSNAAAYGGTDSGAGGIGSYVRCDQNDSMLYPVPDLSTGVVKFRVLQTSVLSNLMSNMCYLVNGLDNSFQLALSITFDGMGVLTRGSHTNGGGTILATSGDKRINTNGIYHFSWLFEIANSTSSAQTVYVNGLEWITLASGADTQGSATYNYATSCGFSHASNIGGNALFYDFALFDTTGSVNNTHRGTPRVVPLYANGNGNHSDFTGSDADSTDNYLHLDEVGVADDDTSYAESSTATHRQSCAVENLPSTPQTILAVQVQNLLKKTDAGTRTFQDFLRIGGVNYDSATKSVDTTYLWSNEVWDQDPTDTTDFTEADVNGIEVGCEIVS